jgi:FkbM family methyltransferase
MSLLQKAWHYAHGIEIRLLQRLEWNALRAEGVPVSDRVGKEIWRKPGESEDWINLARFIHPHEPVFLIDVGANVGKFTARAMEEYRDIQSVCFEPAKSTCEQLSKRFGKNRNVAIYPFAASDQDGTATLFLGPESTMFSLEKMTEAADSFYHMGDAAATETICCRRLDSFGFNPKGRKVLLKMDVQGHEEKALVGAVELLRRVDVVIIECSFANEWKGKSPSFAGITRHLADAGLYPIVFQDVLRACSSYPFERDVIFVRENLLSRIWLKTAEARS